MENPFKKIIEEKELPETIKEKVINDINLIKLSLELSELFLVSLPQVAYRFFETEKNGDKKDSHDNENKE